MATPIRTDNHATFEFQTHYVEGYAEITRIPPPKGYTVRLQMSLPSLPEGMDPKEHPPISTIAVYAFYNRKGHYVPEPADEDAAKKGGIATLPFMTVSGTCPRTVAQMALAWLAFRGVVAKQAQGNAETISLPSLLRDKNKVALPPLFTPFGNDAFFASIRAILHAGFAAVLRHFKDLKPEQLPYALSVDITKDGVKKTLQSCGASVDGTGETVLRKPCIHGGPCKHNGGGACVLFQPGAPAGRLGVVVRTPGPEPELDAGLDDGEPEAAEPSASEPSEPGLDFSVEPAEPPKPTESSEPVIDFKL